MNRPLRVGPGNRILCLALLLMCVGCKRDRCRTVEQFTGPDFGGRWYPVEEPPHKAAIHFVTHRVVRVCSDGSTEVVKQWIVQEKW